MSLLDTAGRAALRKPSTRGFVFSVGGRHHTRLPAPNPPRPRLSAGSSPHERDLRDEVTDVLGGRSRSGRRSTGPARGEGAPPAKDDQRHDDQAAGDLNDPPRGGVADASGDAVDRGQVDPADSSERRCRRRRFSGIARSETPASPRITKVATTAAPAATSQPTPVRRRWRGSGGGAPDGRRRGSVGRTGPAQPPGSSPTCPWPSPIFQRRRVVGSGGVVAALVEAERGIAVSHRARRKRRRGTPTG